jgi:hypothetical protein
MDSGDLGGAGDVGFWRAEAERLAVENVVLRDRVAELEGQVGALAEKVAVLARLVFGMSSEKAAKPTRGQDEDDSPGESPPATTGTAVKVSHLHSNHRASRRTHDLRHVEFGWQACALHIASADAR